MGYGIKSVSDMVGVPRNTLLAWERRYGLVTPSRRANGYREYTPDDVAQLRELKALIDAGHRVGEAVSLLRVRAPVQAAAPDQSADPQIQQDHGLDGTTKQLLEALVRYDRARVERLYRTLVPRPYTERINAVLLPLMREFGARWERGEITIAQEHFASAWCREKMLGMLMALGFGPATGPIVVCAGFPDERHELGLLAVAIALALQGYRITWLGSDVPLMDLAETVRGQAPAMVCVSLIQPRPLSEITTYAIALRKAAPARTRVIIGGAGLQVGGGADVPGVEWVRHASHLRA